MSATGTPTLTVIFSTDEMNVRLYTNSWMTSVSAKITTVSRPGIDSGSTMRQMAPTRPQPSTMADSSTSLGNDLKNAMRSQVQKGRRAVEEERVVGGIGGAHVEVGVLLERGHHHPVEGKHREHDEEEDEHAVAQRRRQSSSPTRRHHATSARRDTRSIVTARITSTGSRKMATEAPRPTSPPSTPSWKARLASTWVEL